ncbi:tRNA lysidine(34) synthetase TilS [Wenzhouxiangella sediminis]|uniref:tRNA(Ile)-lysidine synthase n=1 Tax=Wenzhouxiangella sediminis TaxID=1792836 RepID=A0A3E1KBB2_9GAMM|nr:tRNA lysidine(34) synthetase TilS [Wenzhouxiangella sediminis]RFF31910.1 tRNA lysidine(34) synthetase TilS [Wenzhouxiangella sediminis]
MPADFPDPTTLPGRGRIVVAFSGGPDSVCLLHLLARAEPGRELACIHVDHGLDPESGERARRAAAIAARLGVACEILRVEVEAEQGPEASARRARYMALERSMATDDALLTAHHADDQAETVLLRLLRGAGPDGLAGIPAVRRFGPGWLVRPLLGWTRSDIERWLERHRLDCIRDPANDCPDFDRNFLRQEILPALRERWAGADRALLRSGRLCRGAADFVAEQVARDLENAPDESAALRLERLAADSDYYRGAAIRAWCIREGFEPPPGRRLDTFLEQLSAAADDRCPELRWDRAVLRRWRDRLWLDVDVPETGDWRLDWNGIEPLSLPGQLGVMKLAGAAGPALGLAVGSPGEDDAFRIHEAEERRDCKRLLTDAGVPPWQRDLWPRLWLEGRLVALGARWLSPDFRRLLERRGQTLVWETGPRRLAKAGLESGA